MHVSVWSSDVFSSELNSDRPQRIVRDRALGMTRHKCPDVGQKALRSHEIGKTRMLAADKPPDKTKDKQDSGGPACRHVPVRDSAVSFRGQKGNRDRRDQQPVEKPERGIPNPETITVARFCHEHHLRSEENTYELQSLMRISY